MEEFGGHSESSSAEPRIILGSKMRDRVRPTEVEWAVPLIDEALDAPWLVLSAPLDPS